ncbi:hypothetical protein [Sphaerochaeta sp. PS]|uniref:hypothetical protein n=1 Tax=Sphaerochaeta sp. PS TaxID=3076336 RepID=UPI0028A454BB|nr:hypothetical protein [Sphaerochaeta sp. PS]MDT4761822.1 hypothetical protein [Sphaerochaeta sp. PS]
MTGLFDTYEVLKSILEYFKVALADRIAEQGLVPIEEWDIGYRDVASGLHAHPAFLIKSDRDGESSDGPFFQTMETDIALVFRCEDPDEGYQRLCSYQAVLDSILRDDPHFGGNIAEVKKATFAKARDSSRTLFFLFVEADIDIDVLAWRMP